jgi:hypothetical protein
MKAGHLLAASAALLVASAAQAADYGFVIREGVQTVALPNGGSTLAYNAPGEQGGGGFTVVSKLAPRGAPGTVGANGSLEIHGDRSRYVIGSIYENFLGKPAPALSSFKDLSTLTFDWQTQTLGAPPAQQHAAPAVRIHIMDNGIRSEMIWEHVYNGGASGVAPPAGWQTSGASDVFYLNVRDNDGAAFLAQNAGVSGLSIEGAAGGNGVVFLNGGQLNNTIGSWKSYFSDSAIITGLSFGAGSGFGANFVGFIDNVRGTGVSGDTGIVNFEAVPEPATWAMMIGGFGLAGAAMRRRARNVVFA